MNVKSELENYRSTVKAIEKKREVIMELLESRTELTGGGINPTGISATGYKESPLVLNFIRIETKIEKLKTEIYHLEKKLRQIDELIALLTDDQRKIIIDFYLFRHTNRKIASELGVEIEAVKKRKKRIIKKMQKLSDE